MNVGHDSLVGRGGGAKGLDWHYFADASFLVLYLRVHTCDANGCEYC